MEIEQDGLWIYKKTACIPEQYFLAVEYPTIRYNQPERLLPVLLREQDGEKELWYDITHGRTLKERASGTNLSREDCRVFLEDFCQLLEEIDALMLDTGQILFSPEEIYQMEDGHYRWVYMPKKQERITESIQDFFVWMLSEIDYGDSATVRFVYHVYWAVRNKNISKNLIKACLQYEEQKNPEYEKQAEGISAFLSEQKEEEILPEQDGYPDEGRAMRENLFFAEEAPIWTEEVLPEKKRAGKQMAMMGGLLLVILAVVITVWRRNWWWTMDALGEEIPVIILGLAGGVLFVLLLVSFAHPSGGGRRRHFPVRGSKAGEKSQADEPDKKKNRKNYLSQEAGGDAFYKKRCAKEEKTEILGGERFRMEQLRDWRQTGEILLKKTDTGELVPVRAFPFYIGHSSGLNHLMLEDRTVSRRHAVIERGREAGSYVLTDCASTNGTWVNDTPVGRLPIELKQGDLVRFAESSYEVILRRPFPE